jgi:hypothetical protein
MHFVEAHLLHATGYAAPPSDLGVSEVASPSPKSRQAAGNDILRGAPLENIEAFLDEALRNGEGKRARRRQINN